MYEHTNALGANWWETSLLILGLVVAIGLVSVVFVWAKQAGYH